MARQYKTPGVYIVEQNAFPTSVVEVPTAVPAFIGYTQKALRGTSDLTGTPTRITSMPEYERHFGGPPKTLFSRATGAQGDVFTPAGQRFYLSLGMRMFFDNGGGPCWIVSLGGYEADSFGAEDFSDAIWAALAKEAEPTIYVAPDAVALSRADHKTISERMVQECQSLQSRVAILDVHDGRQPAGTDPKDWTWSDMAINGAAGFRAMTFDTPSYGAAYFPWLNTNVLAQTDIDFTDLDTPSRAALSEEARAWLAALPNQSMSAEDITKLLDPMTAPAPADADVTHLQAVLINACPEYAVLMQRLLAEMNVMPPSAAMAGVWTRTDNQIGVWKAPANTGIADVLSPTVAIGQDAQEDLNMPLDGKAINAIRDFPGRGVLVWGARTLDGNSQDWRYISVRRTLIMLEQSIKTAAEAYVFASNDAGTWLTVRTMIENFLNNQWKACALAGATPAEAYDVSVGLGSTMTGQDILDGYMRVTVKVAVVRPAEFIVITFQQQMQVS